ncbi:MAG: hypothetical protein MUF52_06280 [Syntrophobacteraceae bacterium]|jgi:type IV pilus assembly protein PilY1|nr:hypothetical protein [Syntrophobacteraceae bacterium]
MNSRFRSSRIAWAGLALLALLSCISPASTSRAESIDDYSLIPPFVTSGVPPLVMLVMGRDHKLYYEAYNDTTDLNGDGAIDVGYKPNIDYYGYFDSTKCYEYSTTSTRFEPTSLAANKKCSGASEWSGDWLNYVTMSRMDAIRKVLYGGYRSTDTATETVLERARIPQDAHSWGKEYESIARDGYDIREYTPLSLPVQGTRHLFANTTLSTTGNPLLRTLTDSVYRVWEWVSIERPVAGDRCVDGGSGPNCASAGGNFTGYPTSHAQYEDMVWRYGNDSHLLGTRTPAGLYAVDGSGNPFSNTHAAANEYYLHIVKGTLGIEGTEAGTYEFAVDGDDALELIIGGTVVASWYGGHGRKGVTPPWTDPPGSIGSINLAAGQHALEFRHQETAGDDWYHLWWKGPATGGNWRRVPTSKFATNSLVEKFYDVYSPASVMTDRVVRVKVGVKTMPEPNCKLYPGANATDPADDVYKPVGLLQRNGESQRMYFGLMTGSYSKNVSGGVLRKNIGPITDEINAGTGQFTAVNGIIRTLDKLRVEDFNYGNHTYDTSCGWIVNRPINEGECRMWGNPVGEMMYETLRYYSGASGGTPDYLYDTANAALDDNQMGLPVATWQNPYSLYSYCAKPFMLVISDINPSFDSDKIPGKSSAFGSAFSASSLTSATGTTFAAETLANTISTKEGIAGQSYYVGHSASHTPAYDGSCSSKNVGGFGTTRGLCPEEPTKEGSFYSASSAHFGLKEDISSATGDQNVATYVVGLASPLPRIAISVDGKTITLVPFAKSVGGCASGNCIDGASTKFQPTNAIVDFYVDTITPTYGRFRINFEDVEQGADHDMDAIVIYEYQLVNGKVQIKLTSEYAAGSIIQHMGYIISGTTADGTYLEVRDKDTAAGSDVRYFLDTGSTAAPLPLVATREFTPGSSPAAKLLESPLWYAAKWGGFEDTNNNDEPDLPGEWDKDNDGVPDNYFYVVNPLRLEEQLNKSFADILRRASSGTAASVISSSRSGEGAIYQAIFYPDYKDGEGNTVNWVGEVHALLVDAYGNIREDTDGNGRLDLEHDYFIEFSSTSVGTIYKYRDGDLGAVPVRKPDGRLDAQDRVNRVVIPTIRGCRSDELLLPPASRRCVAYLWSANSWLNEISSSNIVSQRSFTGTAAQRHIFTFIDGRQSDADLNMIPDAGKNEIVDFVESEWAAISPYVHVFPPFASTATLDSLRTGHPTVYTDFVTTQTRRVINFIRGQDQGPFSSTTTPAYGLSALRSRQSDYDDDAATETWRLGDVVFSTPTIVAAPAEDYDLLYRDASYIPFYRKYRDRRTVVYAGANDGMLHAFNGGFYKSSEKKFYRFHDPNNGTYAESGLPLGAELWGFIPYNLLPHLHWLSGQDYGKDVHVSYVDLKPRVFDAKIFPDSTTHPNGWGTVMVCGMRFGGGKIRADRNKNGVFDAGDRTMRSAYVILDVTDPEARPTLLAEISSDDLGFTTSYPTVIAMKEKSGTDNNDWFLVLGSGPHGSTVTLGSGAAGSALSLANSDQPGKIMLLDLKALASSGQIRTVDGSGVISADLSVFAELDSNAFISDPISVDYDLDYKTDVVYFGTVSGGFDVLGSGTGPFTGGAWGGKLRRLLLDDNPSTATWVAGKNSVLLDLSDVFSDVLYDSTCQPRKDAGGNDIVHGYGQPIVAAPAAGRDKKDNRWVFVGTGRFFNRKDAGDCNTSSDVMTFYGIKEPRDPDTKAFTWATVNRSDLLNVTDSEVFEDGNTVRGIDTDGNGTINTSDQTNFTGLRSLMSSKAGWLINLDSPKERNLGQATLLGDVLTFTSYTPSVSLCEFEGNSSLYAVMYDTGTAYTKSVIGTNSGKTVVEGTKTKKEILSNVSLGKGLTVTPNIHTGRQEGSKVFVQTSTGTILELEEQNPGMVKSGKSSWREWLDE